MKKLIYRIEDYNGEGFYRGDLLSFEDKRRLHLYQANHIAPEQDWGIKRGIKPEEKCGFLNEKQLYDWVDRNKLRYLLKKGYRLVRRYKEVTAIGEHQILFKN